MKSADRPVSPEELLWAWLRCGWRYRVGQGATYLNTPDNRKKYKERLDYEVDLITRKNFISYFIFMSDTTRFAKDAGIPVGPGRGSAASSLMCWLLRITEVDPLLYPLMDFTRFINPEREDMPDVDLDFDDERRGEIEQYLVKKYGRQHVGTIGTFTKFHGKSALTDVVRVFPHINRSDVETIKGLIIERSGGDSRADFGLTDTVATFEPAQRAMERNPDLAKALRLEGNYRGMSQHPAGLVVTNRPITDVCALYTRTKADGSQAVAVSVDKYNAEYLELVKADFLGLSTMGMIRIALEEAGMTLEELYRVPTDDPETIAAFNRTDVIGIFQFEGRATRLVNRDIRPDNFLELVDISALSRPGPLFSGTTAEYTDIKWGRRSATKFHPIIDDITKGTRGQIIYQEQILRALRDFGGLPVKRVHEIRKIISHKLGEAQFNTSRDDFVDEAVRLHGVTPEIAREVWSRVVTSASYAFVYAHSVSYTLLGYWVMYLKIHHPLAFYTAALRKADKERWPKLIRDAERHGITVRGVSPGTSRRTWSPSPTDNSIVAGYEQLEGIGPAKAAAIEEYAETHQINGADDLLNIKGIGKKMVEKIRGSMESGDPFGLQRTGRIINSVIWAIKTGELPLRLPTVTSDEILDVPGGDKIVWVGLVKRAEFKDFVEDERARSGKPIEQIMEEMKDPHLSASVVLHAYDNGDEDVYVRISRFQFPKWKRHVEDIVPDRDVIYVEARRSKSGFGASIYVDRLIVIDPEIE